MSLHVSTSVSEEDTTDSGDEAKTARRGVGELSDSALLDSDEGGGEDVSVGGWDEELQLDYEEDLAEENEKQPGKVCEEDEVKVHATWNIEGELSSGEEGEIRGACDTGCNMMS